MRLWRSSAREDRRQDVLRELWDLYARCQAEPDREFVQDMILYAEIGRNRFKLENDYVAKTAEHVRAYGAGLRDDDAALTKV